jgi:hypothetical protein
MQRACPHSGGRRRVTDEREGAGHAWASRGRKWSGPSPDEQ